MDTRGERDLIEDERDEIEQMLRTLSVEREPIRHCMGWCITRAAASDEIVETIAESLTLKQTPAQRKLARLFLVSDILHNSAGLPKAASFRSRFQPKMADIFRSFHDVCLELESKMAVEMMREQVTKVLQVWQAWSLFPPSVTARLERLFIHGDSTSAAPLPLCRTGDFVSGDQGDVNGKPMLLDDDVTPGRDDGRFLASVPSISATIGLGMDAASERAKLRLNDTLARALSSRELEAVCEVNGLSTVGSRAEMLGRVLAALRCGRVITWNTHPKQAAVPQAARREGIDGEDIDGEDIGEYFA